MDEFFMTHLPVEIIKAGGDYQNHELDEDAVRRVKKSEVPTKKNRSQTELDNYPQAFNRNQSPSGDILMVERKSRESDFTLASMDSSEQVAKLAYQSEVGQKIQKMRTVAKSQYRESPYMPRSPSPSQFQGANVKMKTAIPK